MVEILTPKESNVYSKMMVNPSIRPLRGRTLGWDMPLL
jgi:hypothetical protein